MHPDTSTATPEITTAANKPRPRRRILSRVLAASAITIGVAAGGGYLWLDRTSDVHNLGTTACTTVTPSGAVPSPQSVQDICDLLDELTAAWGRGDADAYGALFTEDATYTSYMGTYYQGRTDIAEGHRALFGGFVKGTELADSILGIRFYGSDTAVVTSRGDTYKGDRKSPEDLSKAQTYTVVRQDGHWRIAAFHNTQRKNVMERISFLYDPDTRPAAER
ncbi:SgcJ/EcaC family oxidoreductase [Nocardia sp. GCM10030253]|uniref:SgcJ/EcaC family oxidoreductase n=1 Tax=Nocardia sp. GCM10030253 TaxID=3273404 RepID=UPI00362532B6